MRQGKRHITYDSTNQLVSAANTQTYALSVTYGDWGKIQQYDLSQTDLASNTTTSQTRYYSYGSLNEGQTTFAPNNISYADGTNVNEQYGINGSLQRRETTIPNSTPSEELYRFGADGNLRMYSYDRLFFALYGYDGGTTRTYKYSFDLNPNWVNGRLEAVNFNPHTAMFYPNSYLNFNSNGYYTKHYYNGTERIASRLGDQNLPINVNDPELQDRKDWQDSLIRKQITEITGYEFLPVGEEQTLEDPKPVFELPQVGMTGLQPISSGSVYYYHSNHLGSTCYVTDENAIVQQGFLYAPFGEITNEHNSSFGSSVIPKYSFNAKELDEETGMYYYEARYMAPPVFISRDPLFEKYPTFSPYAYCANNPVKYVDPDGKKVRLSNNYVGGIENIAKIAATSYGSEIMNHLINQKEVYNLNSTFLTSSSEFLSKTRDINYVGNPWKKTFDGGAFNSMIAMGHELFHAYDYSNHIFGSIITFYMKKYLESRAVSFENYLRESYSMLPLRERYGNIRGDFHQMHPKETISNFITLGHNSDKTSYGFRYTKTSKITKSIINIGGMSIPNEISEKRETFYMVVSMDKNNNVSFKTFNNYKEYKKEISNW